jgi:hypothetical protein
MIRLQIVERPEANLFKFLKRAMRSGELRTFALEKQGTRVVHVRSPGYMKWMDTGGVIACEIRTPREEGKEWQLLTNFVGRLVDRFPALVQGINIQVDAPPPEPVKKRRKRAARR